MGFADLVALNKKTVTMNIMLTIFVTYKREAAKEALGQASRRVTIAAFFLGSSTEVNGFVLHS
jgi:hypothetical protein